jgi:NAD dependent epimerase/dehydratase family enzyme
MDRRVSLQKFHILFLGFGFSAEAMSRILDTTLWRITGTSRSAEGIHHIKSLGHEAVLFDDLKTIDDSVTHIVSSVPPGPTGDPVLQKLSTELQRRASTLQWVAYLSTTGVYGDHGGAWVDENTPLTPNTERGQRRVDAESQWLALHKHHHLPLHIFRLAGIYGPGRNALISLKDGTAKRVIRDGQVFSRIHVDDIAGILKASVAKPNPGRAYNVADDEPCPPQDVITYAASLLKVEPPPEIEFEKAQLSAMARSFFMDSKRVHNTRVKEELGYQFLYPNYKTGLQSLL